MGRDIVIAFSVSTAGLVVANALFHTSQLPEGPLLYWVAGAVWCLVLMRKGEGWLNSLVDLVGAMRSPGGHKSYASEYLFHGGDPKNG